MTQPLHVYFIVCGLRSGGRYNLQRHWEQLFSLPDKLWLVTNSAMTFLVLDIGAHVEGPFIHSLCQVPRIHRKGKDTVSSCMELSAQIGRYTAPMGSLLKMQRLSFNRSGQGSDQGVCSMPGNGEEPQAMLGETLIWGEERVCEDAER